jgi:hypothetical protein
VTIGIENCYLHEVVSFTSLPAFLYPNPAPKLGLPLLLESHLRFGIGSKYVAIIMHGANMRKAEPGFFTDGFQNVASGFFARNSPKQVPELNGLTNSQ